MKKKLLLAAAGLGSLLILSACGTSTGTPNTANNSNAPRGGVANRRPDYGQPTTPPEIRGLVKSIVGNEVDILKIDQPQRASSTEASTTSTTKGTPSLSLGGTGVGPGQGGGGFAGGGAGRTGGGGFAGGQGGGTGTTDRAAMIARLTAMSTGEEKVIIPVGIKMLKSDTTSTTKPGTMIEATLADITADKTVTIWLDNSVTDRKVASFVMIN